MIARAAVAHAAWAGPDRVTSDDVRAAARLALPHRRRRNPFDAPGLDEDQLDALLATRPETEPDPTPDDGAVTGSGPRTTAARRRRWRRGDRSARRRTADPAPTGGADRARTAVTTSRRRRPTRAIAAEADGPRQRRRCAGSRSSAPAQPYRRTAARGPGHRRGSRAPLAGAHAARARRIGATGTARRGRCTWRRRSSPPRPHQRPRGRTARPACSVRPADLRDAVPQGREANLVLFVVDASGSMAARQRMSAVKGAVLSLLLDAYQRRDKVGLITFRGDGADLALPPTARSRSAARRLADLPHGGRTPLAAGLLQRPPRRCGSSGCATRAGAPLLVVVTDGRATCGPTPGRAPPRPTLAATGVAPSCVDCESGPVPARAGRASSPTQLGAVHAAGSASSRPRSSLRRGPRREPASAKEGGLMPQGQPTTVPDDGLTTRQRRNRPLRHRPHRRRKGKSTAAFGLALRGWNQGWPIGVFQFVKCAKWRVGEETALVALGRLHERDRRGRPGRVAQDGRGLVLDAARRAPRTTTPRRRAEGWARDQARSPRETLRVLRARRVHLPDELGLGRRRRRRGDAARPARPPARRHHRPRRRPAADRGRRPRHRDDEGQAPDGRRAEGPAGDRVVTARLPARCVDRGAASGHGKTTVATGLMAALRAPGSRSSPHKVGPDYIDPGYHALACGRPGRNLDPCLVGEDRVGAAAAARRAAASPTSPSIEGVMGLFDGGRRRGFASSAHVASLRAPRWCWWWTRSASRSGRRRSCTASPLRRSVRMAGVILNNVGSPARG